MLSLYVNDNQKDWDVHLPFVTSAYNTSKQASTGHTPFYMLHGKECRSVHDSGLGALPAGNKSSVQKYLHALVKRIRRSN